MTVRSAFASTEPGVQAGLTDTPRPHRSTAVLAAVCAQLVACTPSPPPSGIPPAPAVAAPVARTDPTRWRIAVPDSGAAFEISTHAIVRASADTLVRTDTLNTRTELRVVTRGAALDVTVTVHEMRPPNPPTGLRDPVRAIGRFDAVGGIAFEGAGISGCTAAAAAMQATRELWVRWPAIVALGDQWRDSSATAVCRDGVTLRVTVVREFRLVAADTVAGLLSIERRSTVAITGRGPIRGDTTTVTGTGTGLAMLRLDPRTGWLVDGDASSSLSIFARTTQRTQFVDQRSATVFRRPPGPPPR